MTASPALLLARLAAWADVSGPDADLLARFRHARDEAAFAELVRRHGPAVYRVCRRLVGPAAADDAFQATFLVLATWADSVKSPGAVGSWLVGVAGRVARQMRTARLRRHRHETAFAADPHRPTSDTPVSFDLAEQFTILDEELTRLPDRVRGPVVLCLLEGRTHDQAAADLGGSSRTVRRRLDEGKRLLRMRLERRGVVPAVAAALAAGAGEVATAVPVGLGPRTVAAVFDFLAGGAATTAVPAVIAKGVVTAMIARKLALLLTAAAVGLTAVGVGVGGAGDGPGPAKPDGAAVDATKSAPLAKAPAEIPGVSEYRTPNFAVTAPTAELAKLVGEEAERHRSELAAAWLGRELPPWPSPCKVRVGVKTPRHSNWEGRSSFAFSPASQRPFLQSLEMKLSGGEDVFRHQTHAVACEVMRCILATHFGRPIPLWADEGLALLATPKGSVGHIFLRHNLIFFGDQIIHRNPAIRLRDLFSMADFQKDKGIRERLPKLQCFSVAEFLLDLNPPGGGRAGFLRFVELGMADDGRRWDKAAKNVYRFSSVEEMEAAWLAAIGVPPPADGKPETIPPPGRPIPAVSFEVSAGSPAVGRAITAEAAFQWEAAGKRWFGADRHVRPTPGMAIKYWPSGSFHWTADVKYTAGRASTLAFEMAGPLDRVLEQEIPFVVTYASLADHLGEGLPAWAVHGLGTLAQADRYQAELDRDCRELLRKGKAVRLSALLAGGPELFTADIQGAAQQHAVCRFLLTRKPDADLIRFVKLGMEGQDWNAAVRTVYGVADADALEAEWLRWMATEASRLVPPPPAVTPPAPAPSGPPRIPPTPVDGEPDRVGKVVIRGNTVTSDKVILDLLAVRPGHILRYPQLEESRTNILRSGLFDADDPPTVTVVPRTDGSHFQDIEVRVKEVKTGAVLLGPGPTP